MHDKRAMADNQSACFTSRLFNWHRQHDDGLWLDDGITDDFDVIRQLQKHPWIIDQFNDGGRNSPIDEKERSGLDRETVLDWIHQIN